MLAQVKRHDLIMPTSHQLPSGQPFISAAALQPACCGLPPWATLSSRSMHHPRIAAFLLGSWLLGSLFLAFVATGNFRTVDTVLNSPPPAASQMIQTLGRENARQLLRYLAGEENRGYFEAWELAQLVIGTALAGFLLVGSKNRLLAGLAGAMLALTLFQHFKITPEMLSTGRSIDFLPRAIESEALRQFWKLHGIYGGIEAVKMLLAATIAGFLFSIRRRRLPEPVEVDPVDYAHHSHINR
jgi:hypothetical protein